MRLLTASIVAAVVASAAQADIFVRFSEGAPKDRFEFTNTGTCPLGDVVLTLDLSQSAAGLIFDTTGSGAGVSVFQPFELVAGADLVSNRPKVSDGMNSVTLRIPTFPADARIAFTVDVDDTLSASDLGQIRVAGSEIAGAVLSVGGVTGRFDTGGTAKVAMSGCNA